MDNESKKIVPKKTPKAVWWIIGIIILFIFLSLIGGSNNQSSSQSSSTPQAIVPPVVTACSNFKTSQAKTISFKQLNKDPDSFKGTPVKFTGQVVQIQESGGQGVIRLAVTKESYGWSFSDIIYVNYTGHNDYIENDILTVYGILQGSYTYTSQANFQITLPSMEACSIEKPSVQKVSQTSVSTGIPKNKTTTPTVPPIPVVPKSWHMVTTFSGQTEKNTSSFTIQGSQWRINWQETGDGYFGADAESPDGSGSYCSIANLVGSGSDSTYCYKSGNYYISVNASSSWNMAIEDYY